MTVNQAAQRVTSVGADLEMAVRATDPVLTIIVFGRPAIAARLRCEPGTRVVQAETTFEMLGELGLRENAARPPVLVFEPSLLQPGEAQALAAAARRIEPHTRIVSVGEASRIPGVDACVGAEGTPAEWRKAIHRAASESPHLVAAPDLEEPDSKPDLMQRDHDEAALSALLSGRDVLGPLMAQVRRAFVPHEVRLHLATDSKLGPQLGAGEAHAVIQHRNKVLGWLVGPALVDEKLRPAARWLALWLAVQEQHASLRTAALTDALTGAWNRRYFDRFLESILTRAKRRRNDVTLLLFDIDNFKSYNDRYGHAAGDEILREVVILLGSVIRPTDRVCRIGGDEFAVVFDAPDGPRDPASRHPALIVEVARRFQKQIQAHRFPKLGDEAAGTLSISAGLATFPWDAGDSHGLLDVADRHLLESKRQGKNRLTLGPPDV